MTNATTLDIFHEVGTGYDAGASESGCVDIRSLFVEV